MQINLKVFHFNLFFYKNRQPSKSGSVANKHLFQCLLFYHNMPACLFCCEVFSFLFCISVRRVGDASADVGKEKDSLIALMNMSSSQNPFLFSIIRNIQDWLHSCKLDWPLKIRDPKKHILSFGIGSIFTFNNLSYTIFIQFVQLIYKTRKKPRNT